MLIKDAVSICQRKGLRHMSAFQFFENEVGGSLTRKIRSLRDGKDSGADSEISEPNGEPKAQSHKHGMATRNVIRWRDIAVPSRSGRSKVTAQSQQFRHRE